MVITTTISIVLILKCSMIENFQSSNNFISFAEFTRTIDKSPFFVRMSPVDLYARGVVSKNEYKTKYINAFVEFTPAEKTRLDRLTSQTNFAPTIPWKFAKVKDTIEHGFPHTLEDLIVLSDKSLSFDDISLTETLIHEKVHVFQRRHEPYVKNIIARWGFHAVPPHVRHPLHRNNPDLPEENYALTPGTVIMQLYNSSHPASITDSKPCIISLQSNEVRPFYNPGLFPSYVQQLEHPYEIMATIIAHEYMNPSYQTPLLP